MNIDKCMYCSCVLEINTAYRTYIEKVKQKYSTYCAYSIYVRTYNSSIHRDIGRYILLTHIPTIFT